MMESKGFVLTGEFKFTKLDFYLNYFPNCTIEDFKKTLENNIHRVEDIAVDKSSYLILVNDKKTGQYLYDVDSRDIKLYLPIEKFLGYLVPIGLDLSEKLKFIFDLESKKDD